MVADAAALAAFGDEHGWPVIAKTSRGGYDGKGVWRLESAAEAGIPFAGLAHGVAVIAEEFVDFQRELSALVVRSPSGQAAAYPISESLQRNGICVETVTPAPGLAAHSAMEIERLALTVAHELGVVGVLAVELMQRRGRVGRGQRAGDAAAQHRPLDASTGRTPRSSRTTCGRCSICRWATRVRATAGP